MPTRSRRLRHLASAAAGALLLAACGSATPDLVAAPGVQPRGCGDVRIAVNPWTGYSANVAVISYLATSKLGCKVTLVKDAESVSWEKLSTGKVDAILENWGDDPEKRKYIDQQKVAVEAGLTGNKGVIGWYIPAWMTEEYPDITNYKNLNKYVNLFKTDKSGNAGQFLAGDKTFVTNDPALLKNYGLNFKVVYAGSEDALIAAFRDAQEKKTPLLGYFYSPQWLLAEVKLVHIPLETYTPGCDTDTEKVRCDYQPYDLDKIMNARFARSGSPAAQLIENFSWTDADQNQVARDLTNKVAPDDAAKKWLDAHPQVWKAWLPSTN